MKKDFPILAREVHGKRLVYLDNAATTQKPQVVIDALTRYYTSYNSNIHRGIHALSEEATAAFEGARKKVVRFIGASDEKTLIFTRSTTEAINLVAYGWGEKNLKAGDEIILTIMEHHSNLVPWIRFAQEKGVVLRYVELSEDGKLDLNQFRSFLNPKVKLFTVTHMSNVLGTINPVAEMVRAAKRAGAVTLVDGAQSVPHLPVRVEDLGCDFLAFSAHKMVGPTGVGALWGRRELLEAMDPFNYGGDMIRVVHRDRAEWNEIPWKFEAGTSSIADAIAFGVAVEYLAGIGMENVRRHEIELGRVALRQISEIPGVTVYGPKEMKDRGGLVSFNIHDIHPHDLGTILDREGVAIRAGHHCAMPLMKYLNVAATARASFYIYNTLEDIEALIHAIAVARDVFSGAGKAGWVVK